MQSLDLLGLQRDRRIAPTEADIRMMAFGFREFTNLLNKGKRLAEISKPKAPLDAVSFLHQLPLTKSIILNLNWILMFLQNVAYGLKMIYLMQK